MKEYKGHNVIQTNGYFDVYYPEHPNARKNGCVMLQILVAEEMLGRHIKKGEVVHHKDFDRQNNDPNNLMVFASQQDHMFYHYMIKNDNNEQNYNLYMDNGVFHCEETRENVVVIDGKRQKKCSVCGKPINMYAEVCKECNSINRRKAIRPDRGILKSEIRTQPFIQIGKKYNVSDNAIRKWCKNYGLPSKSTVIANMNDVDWEKV